MKNRREEAPHQEDARAQMGGSAPQPNGIRRMPAASPEQTFFHFDFLRALQMHRGLALGIFLAALLLSAAYTARRWNNYKAESLVYVQPAPPRLLESAPGQQQWPYDANTYETYIQQQIHNVTREDVLAGAVRRIDGFKGQNEDEQAAAGRLGGDLEVARVSTGYQISITATAGSANEAAQMANAVAESFIEGATRELRSGNTQRLELLRDERDRVLKELASDCTEQETLNKQLGVAAVGSSTPDPYDDQIAATRAELVKARTANDQAAARLVATTGGPSSAALDAEADEIVAADPGLASMKTALNKRRADLISQMANLTPSDPLYKQDTEELSKINSSLDAMTTDLRAKAEAQIEQKLKNDLERTAGVEARLNGQLAQMTGAAGSATPRLQRASDLATDIARLQARFTTVDEQFRNLGMENAAPGAVYLSAPAIAPLHADRKMVYRNGLAVLLAGIVFALVAALIAHNLDPRVYVAADVEQVLGFAPMALLPDLYEVDTGVAEEYLLRLAAAVEQAHQQDHLHSCIFTAVTLGAGATTVSQRVCSMLQAMGRETVLVDTAGAPQQEDVRSGSDLIHLGSGSRSSALLQQMEEEASEETIVVTDTAPLLVSGETEYLARFVDSVIVIIESGVTTRAQLREVAQTLKRLDVAAVGFVLNRISLEKANPAFRQSVRAVEKHLKAQTPARPSVPEPAEAVVPVGVREELQKEASPPQATAAAPPRETEAGPEVYYGHSRPNIATDQELLDSVRKSAEFDAMETLVEPVRMPPEAAGYDTAARVNEDATIVSGPAKPGEPRKESGPARPPVPARPARGREGVQVVLSGRGSAPSTGEPVPDSGRARPRAEAEDPSLDHSLDHSLVQPPAEPEAAAARAPERRRSSFAEINKGGTRPQPLKEWWDELQSPEAHPGEDEAHASPVMSAQDAASSSGEPDGEPDENFAASRLSGLRNLFVSLGVQNLHHGVEQRKVDAPSMERVPERAVFAQPVEPSGPDDSSPAPMEVTARPEIIPPRFNPELVEREKEPKTPAKSPHVNRWDSPDDVEILPSRRGQYRRRR